MARAAIAIPAVFSVLVGVASASPLKTLYDFPAPTGSYGSFAVAKSGTMYGVGSVGGTAGLGTVFKFDPNTKAVTTLYNFQGGADGAQPAPGLVMGKANEVFGVTEAGGASGYGTVFAVNIKTGAERVLHAFTGADGKDPKFPPVFGMDGELYGTAYTGGSAGMGSLYTVSPSSGKYTVLVNFTGVNGSSPNALTLASSGLLYGTSYAGGSIGTGTLYTFDPTSGQQTILSNFSTNDLVAGPLFGLVLGADGLVFGTGTYAPYQFDPKTGTTSALKGYTYFDAPTGPISIDASGKLYGTTYDTALRYGTVYQIDPTTNTAVNIYTFKHYKSGVSPAGVVFGKAGKLYGATLSGGTTYVHKQNPGYGTIFAITP